MRYVIYNPISGHFLAESAGFVDDIEDAWPYATREDAESEMAPSEEVIAVRLVIVEETHHLPIKGETPQ